MAVTTETIKTVREMTGAGVLECKKALESSGGDIEKAVVILREKGIAAAQKRTGKATAQGLVSSYIHAGGKIGVLVELNCETDFVARTDEFQQLAREIAMHVAAEDPQYVNREQVPAELLEKEKDIYRNQALAEGKPEKVVEKIIDGKLNNFYAQICLLDQKYVRDDTKTVGELVKEVMGRLGENIVLRRFVRLQLGGGLETTPEAE
jgi:elongation factor Ts